MRDWFIHHIILSGKWAMPDSEYKKKQVSEKKFIKTIGVYNGF